ncbi:MAG: EamA family transporter [Clostridiales bacterium]|nr:EamA family transporter [Clostridiales bacterium]
MFSYIWPIALAVLSNTVYHISSKSVPEDISPFASLTLTYLIAALVSLGLHFALGGGSLIKEYGKLNWAPFALGLVIVGLEAGFMYAYKAGWQVSTAALVQSCFLAVILILVGRLCFDEALSWKKLLGAALCLIGIAIING